MFACVLGFILAGCGGQAAEHVASIGATSACFDGVHYAPTFEQTFSDAVRWRAANGGKWVDEYPWGRSNPGAKDAAYYSDSSDGLAADPFAIVDGRVLRIEAKPAPPGLQVRIDGREFVSGLISTGGPKGGAPSFTQRYGYYEVVAQLPKGQGLWPSFWMLDARGARNEIDVFELLGSDPATLYQSYTRADYQGKSYPYKPAFDPTAGFHAYGVLVTPSSDTYFVDGVATHSVPDVSGGPFYFMVSLQVGAEGSWPGPPNDTTTWPANLYVRSFRAFASTGTSC